MFLLTWIPYGYQKRSQRRPNHGAETLKAFESNLVKVNWTENGVTQGSLGYGGEDATALRVEFVHERDGAGEDEGGPEAHHGSDWCAQHEEEPGPLLIATEPKQKNAPEMERATYPFDKSSFEAKQ